MFNFIIKSKHGNRRVKARLVARGFEENSQEILKDSPTCSKESLRLILTFLATNNWLCNSIDIKSAFLQGKSIDRIVYLSPPRESKENNVVWKLNTCIYGLTDASRNWYLRIKDELLKLDVKASKNDPAVFFWHHEGILEGIMATHVDDFCWGGSQKFIENVINPVRKIFSIGVEHSKAFTYLGLNLSQDVQKCIRIDQISYVEDIEPIKISKERSMQKSEILDKDELKQLRTLIGQLGWVCGQTRPDISFDVCELSASVKHANVEDMIKANKVLVKAKNQHITLQFNRMSSIKDVSFVVYNDSSFGNLQNGGSQGGYIIFIKDKEGNVSPIMWQSKRLQRVVKSTMAAETLIQVEAAEAGYWLSNIFSEIYGIANFNHNIVCYTDSRQLYDAVHSIKSIVDKRLRIDIAILREMLERKELKDIQWIDGKQQLANCLTKRGASCESLLQVLYNGMLH